MINSIPTISRKVAAWLVYGGLWIGSLLPLWFLFGLSSALAWLLRVVVRYRRKVVRDNFRKCFPEANAATLIQWEKAYYQHLTDVMMETLKSVSISGKQLDRRMKILNSEEASAWVKPGQGGIVLASHYGNFEWVSLRFIRWLHDNGIPSSAIYARLSSKVMEKVILAIRGRWKTNLVPKKLAIKESVRRLREGHVIGFMSDQSPPANTPVHMIPFLGRPTRWLPGVTKLALKMQVPVLFADVTKVKRGRYEIRIVPLYLPEYGWKATDESARLLVEQYVAGLEKSIRRNPPYWLWSHKRWKWTQQPEPVQV